MYFKIPGSNFPETKPDVNLIQILQNTHKNDIHITIIQQEFMNHKPLKQVSKTLFYSTLSIHLLIYQMIAKCIELCVLFTCSVAIENVRAEAEERKVQVCCSKVETLVSQYSAILFFYCVIWASQTYGRCSDLVFTNAASLCQQYKSNNVNSQCEMFKNSAWIVIQKNISVTPT